MNFDPNAFMNTEFKESNATRVIPCPVGDYAAMISKVDSRTLPNGSVVMDVTWSIDDARAKETTGRPTITCRQTVWLDFDTNGGLAFGEGKNVGLGRLRAALGQNTAGQPWSPSMLSGKTARVKVTHRADKDSGDIYDQVSAVAAL